MTSFSSRPAGLPHDPPPRLICAAPIWTAGVAELRRRTENGTRESGAFLLGHELSRTKRILEFVYYDDIDPFALSAGYVHFAGHTLGRLWDICRARGYGVVADVHVHPRGFLQSPSDQANPVIPRSGHTAVIIPDYALGRTEPGGIGLYEYLGNGEWRSHSREGKRFFEIEGT